VNKLRGAFTLVELLVVLAVIAILTALSLGGLSKLEASSDRSKALSNMRQIGTGITLFAADNDGKLPGPLWPGQMPQFDPNNLEKMPERLVGALGSYLGIPTPTEPKVEALFVPPAYRKAVSASFLDSARTYVLNMRVADADQILTPWGTLPSKPSPPPLRLSAIPAQSWGFSDADALHPHVVGKSWAANTPQKPVHTPKRLAWFFNGSVAPVDDIALAPP
jgi:prepilin-type N-terminal cleavage/methylation domain-containing protein